MSCDGYSVVGWAVKHSNVVELRSLLESGAPLDEEDEKGWLPIHEASHYVLKEQLEVLLEYGKDYVNWRNRNGETILHLVCKNIHSDLQGLEMVQLLLDNGADPSIKIKYERLMDYTPLTIAATSHQDLLRTVAVLLSVSDLTKTKESEYTPLHAVTLHNKLSFVRMFLDAGAPLHIRDRDSRTPLHIAAKKGLGNCLKLLLKAAQERGQGYLVNSKDCQFSPLMLAVKRGSLECIEVLLSYGASVNEFLVVSDPSLVVQLPLLLPVEPCYTPLHYALFRKADIAVLNALLSRMDLGQMKRNYPTDFNGEPNVLNPIKYAIDCENAGFITLLKNYDELDINTFEIQDPLSETAASQAFFLIGGPLLTPLGLAVRSDKWLMVKAILEEGASCNYRYPGRLTRQPLNLWFTHNGALGILNMLLEHNANLTNFFSIQPCHFRSLRRVLKHSWLLAKILRYGADARNIFTGHFDSILLDLRYQDVLIVFRMLLTFVVPFPGSGILRAVTRLREVRDFEIVTWSELDDIARSPRSLMALCRAKYFRTICDARPGRRTFVEAIRQSLQIPDRLKTYLMYPELDDMVHGEPLPQHRGGASHQNPQYSVTSEEFLLTDESDNSLEWDNANFRRLSLLSSEDLGVEDDDQPAAINEVAGMLEDEDPRMKDFEGYEDEVFE